MKKLTKRIVLPIVIGLAAIFGTSCYSDYGSPHAKRGAVLGGIAGAAGGALIGEHNDRELEGAAVGGVVGAIAGGLLGSARDDAYYGRPAAPRPYYQNTQAPPYRSYSSSSNYYYPRPVIRASYYGGHSHYRHRPYNYHGYRGSHHRSYRSSSYCR